MDMRHLIDLGPAKFSTGARNGKEQLCYYNYNKKDRAINCFLVIRKQTSTDAIVFSIVNLIDKSNKHKDIYFKIGNELREFNNVSIQSEPAIRGTSESSLDGRRSTGQQQQQQQQ